MSLPTQLAKTLATLLGDSPFSERMHDWADRQQRKQQLITLCERAMRYANYAPLSGDARLVDVGILAYHTTQQPKIVRSGAVAVDSHWLRPFIELHAQTPQHPTPMVDLLILNQRGIPLFRERQTIALRGRVRVVAKTWLPLQTIREPFKGRWSVVVYLNEVLMAVHRFEWMQVGESEILNLVQEDGEITPELQHEVKHGQFAPMSLDELLADQD